MHSNHSETLDDSEKLHLAQRKLATVLSNAFEAEMPGIRELIEQNREHVDSLDITFPLPAVPQERFSREAPENESAEVQRVIAKVLALFESDDPDMEEFKLLKEVLLTAQTREHVANTLRAFGATINPNWKVENMPGILIEESKMTGEELSTEEAAELTERHFDRFGSDIAVQIPKGKNGEILTPFLKKLGFHPGCKNPHIDTAFMLMANITHTRITDVDPIGDHSNDFAGKDVDYESDPRMMSREKLLKFLQLPQVFFWLQDECRDNMTWGHTHGSLSVAAEYYAENDCPDDQNEITTEDIEEWLRQKIEKYDPCYFVLLYLHSRISRSAFYEAADNIITPAMRVRLLKECPLTDRLSEAEKQGDHEALIKSLSDLVLSDDNATYDDLCALAKFFEGDTKALFDKWKAIKGRVKGFDEALELYRKACRQEEETLEQPYDIEAWGLNGFIHLDRQWLAALAHESSSQCFDGHIYNAGMLIEEGLKELSLPELQALAKKIRANELGISSSRGQEHFRALINERIHALAGPDEFLATLDDEQLIEMSEERESCGIYDAAVADTTKEYACTAGIALKKGEEPYNIAAQYELLSRHLSETREGQGLVDYLMTKREAIRPTELVLPFANSVNPGVIQEFVDHPDLYALLQITTLLQYLGYDQNQVFEEVKYHAEQAAQLHHPEMYSIGVEIEQANYAGLTLNPRFAWLLNVMVRGGDWDTSHEITTARTFSPYLQSVLIALISKAKFGFMNTGVVWQEQREGRRVNSIHATVGIGKEFDVLGSNFPHTAYRADNLERFRRPFYSNNSLQEKLAQVSNATMFAYHTDPVAMHKHFHEQPNKIPMGAAGIFDYQWKYKGSLLETQRAFSHKYRMEEKCGYLSADGGHEDLIDSTWALGNAALHHFAQTQSAIVLPHGSTGFSHALAGIYESFAGYLDELYDDKRPITDVSPQEYATLSAELRPILARHTEAVRREIRSAVAPSDAQERIIIPYRAAA